MLIATIQGVTEDDMCEEVTDRWEDSTETDKDTTLTLQERLTALAEKGIDHKRHNMTDEQFDALSKLLYAHLDLFAISIKTWLGRMW